MRGRILGSAILFLCAGATPALAIVDAVRQYDENAVQANVTDVSATALTAPVMTTNVANAFDNGLGGVINFDNGAFTDPMTLDARFAGGNKTVRLQSLVRNWSIGVLGTSTSAGPISGGNVAFIGAPSPFPNPFVNDLAFEYVRDANTQQVLPERVTSFGFTVLDATSNSSGNDMHFEAYFSDGSSQTLDHQVPFGFNSFDTFFGWTAPPGQYITHILWTATNNSAADDWAFITAVVPEPGIGVMGMALLGLFARRRRN
jgi:hypothetical protein